MLFFKRQMILFFLKLNLEICIGSTKMQENTLEIHWQISTNPEGRASTLLETKWSTPCLQKILINWNFFPTSLGVKRRHCLRSLLNYIIVNLNKKMKVSKFIRVASTYNFHPNFRFPYFSEEIEQNLIEPISVPFATHQNFNSKISTTKKKRELHPSVFLLQSPHNNDALKLDTSCSTTFLLRSSICRQDVCTNFLSDKINKNVSGFGINSLQ